MNRTLRISLSSSMYTYVRTYLYAFGCPLHLLTMCLPSPSPTMNLDITVRFVYRRRLRYNARVKRKKEIAHVQCPHRLYHGPPATCLKTLPALGSERISCHPVALPSTSIFPPSPGSGQMNIANSHQ